MNESQGAAAGSSGSIALKRQEARRSENGEFNLDDEDAIAQNQRLSETLTKHKREDEVHVAGQANAPAKNRQISQMDMRRSTFRWRN